MANTAQARKRVRQAHSAKETNMPIRTNMRTHIKRVKAAIGAGDATKAGELFLITQKVIDKACQKGLIAKNTAARYKSRMSAKIKALKS